MHYGPEQIIDLAKPAGNGWTRTELTLQEDDTAHCGASTKWQWKGPGTVTYLIHPSGWTEDSTASRTPRS